MESTGSNAGISPLDELQRQLAEDLAQVVAAPTPPPAAQPSTNLVATTVSTIVLQGGPLQLVIALLKSGERLYIKVADLLPKFTFLGPSLDEALNLQREHEELLRQIQNLPTPLEEFYHKVQEKIAANEQPNPVLIEEMAASLGAVWQDIKKMLQERRDIVLFNVSFFERLGECYGKMSSLEVACNDTMIPIEIDAVRDFLESFKTLRTDMLTSISAALKVGNQLLDRLRELANIGTLDSRPNHIKQDAIYAVGQVERWLEDLSNRRNNLEQAWQSRKTQLEQCLTLAILAKELADIEYSLNASRNSNLSSFTLGDSSEQARDLLDTYQNLKPDALLLRDKSLKITKATEELVATGCFAGDEACAKAYSVLAACTEFVDEIDHRESLLSQSREFFGRAENLLTKLTQIEMELSNDQQLLTISEQTLQELTSTITQVLQAGYSLIDDVGRTKPEVTGVQTMVERIEQKKLVFERYSLQQSEHNLRLTEALNEFMERYNLLFQWMADARKERIEQGTGIHRMGESLAEAKDCLLLHHQLLNDLEIKGNAINNLLARLTPSLEYLEDGQRDDVQQKVDLLRQQWIELKNYVIARVDLLKLYIRFHQEAETVRNLFDAYQIQRDTFRSGENDKPLLQAALDNIRQQLAQLGPLGGQFRECAAKVASDPYLQQAQAVQCVERTLAELNARQLAVGNEWDRWNAQHHTEAVLNDIMAANMETLAAASKLEEQLYPIFNTASDNPTDLSAFIATKLNQIQADIRAAEHELTKRFETIDQLATPEGDSSTSDSTDKVIQVKNSLNSIKTKLHTIAADFQELATVIDRFLHAVLTCRDNIKEYFASKQTITGPDSVESITNSYEQFKQNTMEYFRNLLQQSEQIIDRIKAQEPPGAKEQDTDKIITLLENLRTYFESETESENSELRKQHAVIGFDKALNEVRGAIRERREQVDRARGNYGENADGARGTLAAFEEFERGLQDLESRIETFVSSSQGLASQYPETSQYVHAEATKVRNEWADLVNRTQEYRQLTTVSIEYFELISVVENNYRNLNADLINANNKLSILNNSDLANDLVQQIDNILKVYETQQLDTLKQISALSSKLYDHDKSVALYNDNLKLFQTFYKIKNDINERAKELTEQQRSQEAEQNGFCEITTTTTTTTHNGLPQQQSFDIQTVDEAQYIQEPQEPLVIQTVEESHNVQSHEVVTTVEQPPATLSVPQPLSDVSVQEGQRVQLQCVIFGRPEPSIEWFKDGISIQNNPDYKTTFDNGLCTLTIDETVTADSAEFLCRAINDAGIAESAARLIVTEPTPPGQPPLFTQQLNNGTATEGHPFQYRCTVTGTPTPELHWYKNDTCIDTSSDYKISHDPATGEAVLSFEQVFLEDQARYRCRASNVCGSDETGAELSVEPLEPTEYPSFRAPLSNVMARVGQKIKLEAEVAGIPPPEVMWTHDGQHFANREVKFFYENGRAQLVIDEAFLKDAGVYTLTAKNIAGERSCSCNVVVKGRLPNETSDSELASASDMEPVKPSVQLQLKDVAVFEGKPVRLDCVIVGQPEPEVIWYHGERPVKESTDFQLLFQGDHCSLVIREAFLEDAGEYRVVAINSAGEASSKCNLIVTPLNTAEPAVRQPAERVLPPLGAPPKFERLLSDILAAEGEKCQFECAVSGDPRPNIKWYVNNREIEENPRVHSLFREDGVVKLVIEQVFPDDKGVYTAKASNPSGEAKCFSNLIVKSINAPEFESVPAFLSESVVCPTFKELFADRTVKLHESTKFECIVVGKPQPKIRWFFNDQPVHGHDFLVSTSGDRQVLTIPEVLPELAGKITCFAENDAGHAQCVAFVALADAFGAPMMQPQPLVSAESMLQVDHSGSSFVTLQKQVTTSSSSYSSSTVVENGVSQSEVHSQSAHLDSSFKKVGDQAPEIAQTKQFAQFHQTNDLPPAIQQETSILNIANNNTTEMHETIIANSGQISTGKPARRSSAPRFVSPFNGKIVDQGADVVLEGILDGYPTPEVSITKNDVELQPDGERITVSYSLNKIVVELKNVSTNDAGRYTATASNAAGASSTTADLVVKKSIFPPVFGRRLQAQSVRRGDRVILAAEVSGTPEPTITWFKDNAPVQEALLPGSYSMQQVGPCHKLIFEQIDLADAGRYMVLAKNTGGEAQSIADIAVLDAEPQQQQQPKHVSFVDVPQPQPVQNNFYTQQQQQHQQQQQMYSSFSSSQQFQSSQMSQQQFSQSMQYQPYQPYKPSVEQLQAPQPIQAPMPVYAPQPTFAPQPQPQPTFAPQPQPTFAPQPQPAFVPQPQPTFAPQPKPVPTYAPAPQTLPQPFKPTPAPVAPVAKFAPAPEPVPVVHHSLASAPSNVPSFGPSYNQTPQPFKPLPPPSITPSQASFTSGPPVDFPPVPQTFMPAYVPPPVQTFTPAPAPVEPIPQFTPAPAPVQAPAPAPMQPPTNFPEPLYQQQPQEQVFGQQHNEYVHHQQLQQYHQQQVHMEEEVYKKKSVKETKQLFEQTIRQQNESLNDLKAPRMIQQMVNSPTKVCTLPPDFGYTPAEIGLEPGPQPTMGYAPKPSNERKSSYYREKIEQSLFESMDKVPERVPAGGVKIIPPSPRKKSNPGQSDTAGMPPASFEQPSEAKATQPIANANAATKSPFTATESECESDMDVMRKMNGVSGYLADTEEVQKTVSFSSEQKIESFSKSESSVIVQSSEVVQQQQEQQQQQQQTVVESSPIESKVETVEDAAATVTDAGVTAEAQQPQQQQQSEEQVVTTTTTTAEAVTKESVEEMNFLVNNDLPEDLQPVKVLPTEEPLPTLKKVPVPAAVQPEPQPEPVVCEPVPEPAPVQQNGFSAEQHEIEAEKTTINPVWQPTQAGVAYKPVHPVFNPPQQHETGPTVAPPSVFDPIEKLPQPTAVSEMARPQPISYSTQQTSSSQSFQQQKSSSFQSYQQQTFVQQQQQQEQQHVSFPPVEPAGQPALYYTSVTAQPVHNTIATETSNTLHMKETTESSNRVVNMQQTQQVISLGHQPRPAFVQKQGRDSDYDSDGARIRPMWTPNPSDSDEPHFRSVRPNFASRSTSLPRTYERIQTPMEFDTGPVLMPTKIDVSGVTQQQQQQQQQQQEQTTETVEVLQTQTLDRKFTTKQMATQHMSTSRDDMAIKAHKVAPINFVQKAQNQAESMSQSFKTKAYHFTNEVMTDMRKTPIKPILKNAFGHQQAPVTHVLQPVPQTQAPPATNGTSTPQAYREESRVSQYGTRHVDPDTGIIYFKYDFGYEFGIIFPGEGHRIVAGSGHSKRQPATTSSSSVKHPRYLSPTPFGPSGAQSVEVPVIHERTRDYVRNCTPSPFRRSASVPASDLQASRYQQRYSYPATGSGRSTPRVTHFRPVSSRCTTPDHSAASVPTQGSTRSATSTPKHPQDPAIATKQPLFVAPLKDIAVVAGQPARFECIVACDATPAVRWTKNNVPIDESGQRYYPEYRNGVCRLSLPVAYEGDSARYCCVAENHLGHSQTCADLTVVDSNWRTASAVTEF
ncbi:uncharacterized protein LOC6039278 isoform X6 [Culex quinquefasciatus]|uniref:uncharacterized protein LOC6039278 isoform X6 n=1 Tax=Culex quinquefasciatus TaxID=7176 RepID=UPI0018E2DD70|nr:uncharacterized protein LOC6039278 isoform X6 [Culex quinquefasciatus]